METWGHENNFEIMILGFPEVRKNSGLLESLPLEHFLLNYKIRAQNKESWDHFRFWRGEKTWPWQPSLPEDSHPRSPRHLLPPRLTYPARSTRPPRRRYRQKHGERASPAPTGPVCSSRPGNSRRWRGPTTPTSRAEGDRSSTSGSHPIAPSAPEGGLASVPAQQKGQLQRHDASAQEATVQNYDQYVFKIRTYIQIHLS